MVDQDIKPTCFDLGYKKVFNINSKNALALSQAYNRNYRLPTLNERFWVPGGKVSLLPELSNGIESTLKHTYNTTKSSQMLSATVYTNKVNNWIQWVPTNTGFWEASNAMQVVTNGIEVFEEIYTKYKNVEYGFKVNYIYNYSTNKVIKKQLIYTPYNIFNITATIKYQQWYAIFNYHYTGFRYTSTDNSFWLPSYTLINASIQKSFLYRNHIYTTSIVCNNILNSRYQTVENFAMPGRSMLIKFQFSNK
jgi:iron complex outermembrane receptor protein